MNKYTYLDEFLGELIGDKAVAEKTEKLIKGILRARSPRQSEIARAINGSEAANHKYIQQFLRPSEPESILSRFFSGTS